MALAASTLVIPIRVQMARQLAAGLFPGSCLQEHALLAACSSTPSNPDGRTG